MPDGVQPAASAGEIVFELERFEREGDRLALSGRWFGVRGRRFMRPTLTLLGGNNRSRALADLEHKPWAAEDGGPWEAAFPWGRDEANVEFELSVSPDITIQLPSPSSTLAPQRLAALPRNPAALSNPSTTTAGVEAPARAAEAAPPRDPELERLESELRLVKANLQAAVRALAAGRAALSERDHELESLREQLATVQGDRESATQATAESIAERDHVAAERDQLRAERERLMAERDQLEGRHDSLASDREQAIAERARVIGERDQLVSERDRLRAERDQLATQLRQMTDEHEQARQRSAQLESQLDQAKVALDAANRERDAAVNARGAALVMGRVVGTPPRFERPASWWRQTLAVVALILAVFAILIVALLVANVI